MDVANPIYDVVFTYLMQNALDGLSDEAVIDVCPRVTERRTGRELQASHPLVEGIHHRSHIIQIPRLASRRRDELERLLAICRNENPWPPRRVVNRSSLDRRSWTTLPTNGCSDTNGSSRTC